MSAATISEIAERYELSKALRDFRSTDGLTLADYRAILHMSLWIRSHGVSDSSGVEAHLTLNGQPITFVHELWEMFLKMREDLFLHLSKLQVKLQLEDVILIRAMIATSTIKNSLGTLPTTDGMVAEAFAKENTSITSVLRELSVMLNVPPDEPFLDWFVGQVNINDKYDPSVNFNNLTAFVKGKKRLAKKLVAYLEPRFTDRYIPEVDVRYYENLTKLQEPEELDDDGQYLWFMRQIGIPDDVITCHGTIANTRHELGHNAKNGLWAGGTVLHILRRDMGLPTS